MTCRHYDDDIFDKASESHSFDSYDTETTPEEKLIVEIAISSRFEFLSESPCRIMRESFIASTFSRLRWAADKDGSTAALQAGGKFYL